MADTSAPAQQNEFIRIPAGDMQNMFYRILANNGFREDKAVTCAQVFTGNSIDGIYTHGVNRFPRFVQYVRDKFVLADHEPVLKNSAGSIEQWDGQTGPGPLNALFATDRVMELAGKNGIGCLALSNTNHWMRGGTYGWKAAKAGFVFIGWTNTIANMPAWGAVDGRLGNNPLVLAVPYYEEAIVMDMAMSQYSYGAMEQFSMKHQTLPVPGGYDQNGALSTDPAAILASQRSLPIGYWKGAGLSLLLDILAAILSGGNSTHEITARGTEYAVSQVFIAIDISFLHNHSSIQHTINQVILDYHASLPDKESGSIIYPGERVLNTRADNMQQGIPVNAGVWEDVKKLLE